MNIIQRKNNHGKYSNEEMLLCYQNCSDLPWEKIVLVIEIFFFEIYEGQEFAKCLRSLEQFIQTIFETKYFFNLFMEFSQI